MEARSLIRSLGGVAKLAAELSDLEPSDRISDEAVQKWCERGAIPARWFIHLLTIADRCNVPLGLADLHNLGRTSGSARAYPSDEPHRAAGAG